ncbi:c-type cytochrome, partial [bacterium]|nr:c-type cytochrome [bacterium]
MKKRYIWVLIPLAAMLIFFITGCEESDDAEHYVDKNWSDADLVRGGQLYDKWWKVNDGTEPASNFDPIWASQSTNTRSNGDSYRCKECHGWDYVGKDGRYSSGSHFTGFDGVWASRTNDKADLFDAIKDAGGDHDLTAELSDVDVLDLTKFIVDGLVNMSLYIDASDIATGDATAGQTLFVDNCSFCHGADGNSLDFEGDDGVQGVGFLANDNPQETLHKVRWGHPGSNPAMLSMVDEGLTDGQIGDILAYAQSLPEGAHFATMNWLDADIVRGALLYDKWWKVNDGTEPTSDFDPIWASQTTNTRSNGDSYRCKECHGWDYIGKDGRYSSGSHYTGFEGLWSVRENAKTDLFDAIKGEGLDHDLSAVLSDTDVLDLTKFVVDGQVDMYLYMDASGNANGDVTAGQTLFGTKCVICHDADGNHYDFESDDGVQGVGWLADDIPEETLHKIGWGLPGSSPEMPS